MAGAHPHDAPARIPPWVHQITELLLGFLLLVQGARTGEHTAVLVGLGGVLVLLVLCTAGPLGVWDVVGRRFHRVLDVVAAIVLAASPLVLSLDHALAIVVLELAALATAWLAWRTDWRPKPRPRRPAASTATSTPAPAAGDPPPVTPKGPAAAPAAPGAPLARRAGQTVGRVRDDGPRTLGRWVGRARAATRPSPPPPSSPDTMPRAAAPEATPEAPSDPPQPDRSE